MSSRKSSGVFHLVAAVSPSEAAWHFIETGSSNLRTTEFHSLKDHVCTTGHHEHPFIYLHRLLDTGFFLMSRVKLNGDICQRPSNPLEPASLPARVG